jgi:hypothetical protein
MSLGTVAGWDLILDESPGVCKRCAEVVLVVRRATIKADLIEEGALPLLGVVASSNSNWGLVATHMNIDIISRLSG